MYNSNDELNYIFSEIFEIIWLRYQTSCGNIDENLLDQNANAFFSGQSVAYHQITEDLRKFQSEYKNSQTKENNHN